MPHCFEELKDDEKWKPRDGVDDEESNKRKRTIDFDDDKEDASSDPYTKLGFILQAKKTGWMQERRKRKEEEERR